MDENIRLLAKLLNWNYSLHALKFIIPLGLSFYIFKCISYNIEIYRETIPAEKNPDVFALYILIYPELISGPIDRPQNLLPQIKKDKTFDYKRVTHGLKLIAWGYLQKWLIADRLAVIVKEVYDDKIISGDLSYLAATIFFAIQIYCDFSAYSDIAIGVGEVLGYKFMKNFNHPYFSRSISEFWSRWHISLSTWLRDYLFLPVAYSVLRRLKNKPFLGFTPELISYNSAVFITMLIAGLWHGASMTFVMWGLIMGFYLIFSYSTKKIRKKLIKKLRLNKYKRIQKISSVIITFILVCISWIFFRAVSFSDGIFILYNVFKGTFNYLSKIPLAISGLKFSILIGPLLLGYSRSEILITYLIIILFIIAQFIQKREDLIEIVSEKKLYVRWAIYFLVISALLIYGKFEHREFIYAQF